MDSDIKNFAEIEDIIRNDPQNANRIADQANTLIRKIQGRLPETVSLTNSEQVFAFAANNPQLNLTSENVQTIVTGKGIEEVYFLVREREELAVKQGEADKISVAFDPLIVPTLAAAYLARPKPQVKENDKKYQKIEQEKKKQWLKDNPGKDFESKEGIDYLYGSLNKRLDDPSTRTLAKDTDLEFKEKYKYKSETYEKKKEKVHKNIADDHAVNLVGLRIDQHTNARLALWKKQNPAATKELEEKTQKKLKKQVERYEYRKFVVDYKTKAEAYASYDEKSGVAQKIKRSLQAVQDEEKRKETQRKRTTEKKLRTREQRKRIEEKRTRQQLLELQQRTGKEIKLTEKTHPEHSEMTQQQISSRLENALLQGQEATKTSQLVTPSGAPMSKDFLTPHQPETAPLPPVEPIKTIPPTQPTMPDIRSRYPSRQSISYRPSPPAPHAPPTRMPRGGLGSRGINMVNRFTSGARLPRLPGLPSIGNLGGKIASRLLATYGVPIIIVVIMLITLLFILSGDMAIPGGSSGGTTPPPSTGSLTCSFTRSGASNTIKSTILQGWFIDIGNSIGVPPAILASVAMHENPGFVSTTDDSDNAIKTNHYCSTGQTVCVAPDNKTSYVRSCTPDEITNGWKEGHAQGLMQIMDLYHPSDDLCSITTSITIAAQQLKSHGITSSPTESDVDSAIQNYFGSSSCTYGGGYSYCDEVWKDYSACSSPSTPILTGDHACPAIASFITFPSGGYSAIGKGQYSYVCGHCTPIYNAIDVGVNSEGGTAVVAVVSGTVEDDTNPYGGAALWLTGDDNQNYYYAHLRSAGRTIGKVTAGQTIGYISAASETGSGNNGIAHVHFSAGTPGNRQSFTDPANISAGLLIDKWCGNNVCNGQPNTAYACTGP